MDEVDEDFVRKLIEEGDSHAVMSEELQTMFPGLRGPSVRTICSTFLYRERHKSTLFSD